MKYLILFMNVFALGSSSLFSQMISPSTIGSFGKSTSVSSILLEDHIGNLFTHSISTNTFLYTEGFLQPDAGTSNVIPPINDVELDGSFYILDAMGSTVENFEENALMEFSIGEMVTRTLTESTTMLTQGVLQPYGKHWTGLVNSDWFVAGNWSPPVIPNDKDDVIIPDLCPNYPILTNGDAGICRHLLMRPGSSMEIHIGASLMANN